MVETAVLDYLRRGYAPLSERVWQALDEVVVFANQAIGNFSKGAGGDVLQMHDLLTSVGAPHDTTAFSGGYLRFLPSGSNTLVQIDTNGGGDSFLTVATLTGVQLLQTDTANFVL